MQVLASAASNMAVDNLVERLSKADPRLNVVRLGHPARLLPQVRLPVALSRIRESCPIMMYRAHILGKETKATCEKLRALSTYLSLCAQELLASAYPE